MPPPPPVARVVDVLIASPGDAQSARNAAERECHNWNGARTLSEQIIFRPRRWELDSVSLVHDGTDPQSVLNRQLVDSAHVLIVILRHRLGSPTPRAVSGTAEELERMVQAGKPVHCYFSTQSLPNNADLEQVQALRNFKHELSRRGLVADFKSLDHLREQIRRALEFDARLLNGDH
jgi:hypothetical protein